MTSPASLLRPAFVTLLALSLSGVPVPCAAQDYPRLGLYGSISGTASPYVTAGGQVDPATADQVARYHEVILDASPCSEYRPDVLSALRARRPGFRLLAYVLGHLIWDVNAADSLVHFPTRYNHLVRDLGGYLYNKFGGWYSIANVNLAKQDGYGHYVVAESLAVLFDRAILRTGLWDGLFLDVYCDDLGWSQSPSESIDVVRAGYPDVATFDAAWRAASDTLAIRLRRFAGPGAILVGNCGFGTKYAWFNGWMRENFPYQDGGTWYENMFRTPGGYFTDDANFRPPPHNYIFTAQGSASPYDANNTRKVRYGLGSAALGDGYGVFGASDRSWQTTPYHTYWYDEYAVDLSNGHATPDLAGTGWLGQPLGPAWQMIWAGTAPDAVSNPDFESDVTSGWRLFVNPPASATLARDGTTAAKGAASARIDIAAAAGTSWYVTLSTLGSIPVTVGGTYSATFWARASTPRTITVVAGLLGQAGLAYRPLAIGTAWKQYQVALLPAASGSAGLQFYLGLDAGSVWLDDAHFQPGATNLYRRDFTNGFVLVNPSDAALTVPLGVTAQKILGTADPATNDGSLVTQVTVPAADALFLLSQDRVPPAAIRDLRLNPLASPGAVPPR
ncbi:MAG: carbohydrate binding domain-containing protein [Candidatus Eisenbacteria bacterium]|nr:carbohydrate binding domain-containing protein [Candidatus Eisenbacteria bacterium]